MNGAEESLGPALDSGLAQAPALLWRNREITYRQLEQLANQAGNLLLALGVAQDERVVLILRDSPALVALFLGAMKVGAVPVPLNLASSSEDLQFVLQHSGCRVVLLEEPFLSTCRPVAEAMLMPPRLIIVDGSGATWTELSPRLGPRNRSADEMAFWLYTSGTTGPAKAVVHALRTIPLADRYLREWLPVQAGQRLFATSKLFFAYALGTCLLGGLRMGATTILSGDWHSPATVPALLREYSPDVMFSVPALYRALLTSRAAAAPEFRIPGIFVSAGEKLSPVVYEQWQHLTGAHIVEGMGTSETLYMIFANRPGLTREGSCGQLAPGAEVRLCDANGTRIMLPGTQGKLRVHMPSLCSGYWQQPQRTNASIQDGWFLTEDVFSFDKQGYWYHHGRNDDLLSAGQESRDPAVIEEILLSLPELADATVISACSGSGTPKWIVYAVPSPSGLDEASLKDSIRNLVSEQIAPAQPRLEVRVVAELPRTASGKVQRYRLRQAEQAGSDPAGERRWFAQP